jgi:hypothetical protein
LQKPSKSNEKTEAKMIWRAFIAFLVFLGPTFSGHTQPFHAMHDGNAVLNLGFPNNSSYPFLNYFRACGAYFSTAGYGYPAILNSDLYVTQAPTGALHCSAAIPPLSANAPTFVTKWSGTATIQFQRGNPGFAVVSDPGGCVSGSTNVNMTLRGTNCRVEWKFVSSQPTLLSVFFPSTGTYGNFSNAVTVLLSQETNLANGAIFNPDFLATISSNQGAAPAGTSLNPKVLRFLNWTNTANGNAVTYSQLLQSTAFTYSSITSFSQGYWAGQISSSDGTKFTATCSVGTPQCSCPSRLTQGLTVQGIFANASTSTMPMFDFCGLGAATIITGSMRTMGVGQLAVNAFTTLTYDETLNEWIWSPRGLTTSVPLSIIVALCNTLSIDCWVQIPTFFDPVYDSASVTSFAAFMAANLKSSLRWYVEYGNEVFNEAVNNDSNWAATRGAALGFPAATGPNEWMWDFYALRRYQVMQLVAAAWTAGGRSMADLVRVETCSCTTPTIETYRYQGKDLTLDSNGYFTLGASSATISGSITVNNTGSGSCQNLNPLSQLQQPTTTGTLNISSVNSGGVQLGQQIAGTGLTTPFPIIVTQQINPTTWCVNQAVTVSPGTNMTLSSNAVSTNYSNANVGGVASQGYPIANTMDVISYAPYLNGGQIYGSPGYPSNNGSDYTAAIAAAEKCGGTVANGGCTGTNAQIAAALQFVDQDVRAGTLNGAPGFYTLAHLNTAPNGWFAQFDVWGKKYSTNPQLCTVPGACTIRGVVQYEGGFQEIAPSIAKITAWNVMPTTNCATPTCLQNEFANLIAAYKQSGLLAQLTLDAFGQFMSYQSSSMPTYFELGPDSTQWSMMGTNLYTTPWQSYNGFARFTPR